MNLPFHDIEITIDAMTCLGIARSLSPFDTGNLRFNAISQHETTDGFVITYSLANAYYIRLLEEGISSNRHIGFIANRTVPAIASYLYSKYSSKNQAREATFKALSIQGNTYMSEENLRSTFDKVSREQRHEQSMNMDIALAFDGFEEPNFDYEQYNPDFAGEDFRMRGRNK